MVGNHKFEDGIIADFKPRFKSIAKDCDRYFDALFDLSEANVIQAKEVIEYSSAGNLWIYTQYIEAGYVDAVEADLIKDVTDKDFYGALFENTCKVMGMLRDRSEHDRIVRIYKAAIGHREKAVKSEHKIFANTKKKDEARNASKKWLKHYLPYFSDLVTDYELLLRNLDRDDAELSGFKTMISEIRDSLSL